MVTVMFFLWGFYLSLKIVGDTGGFWATLAGGLLAPFVFLIVPWYAGFALGDWSPVWISYVAFWASAFAASGGAILNHKLSPQEHLLTAGTGGIPMSTGDPQALARDPNDMRDTTE